MRTAGHKDGFLTTAELAVAEGVSRETVRRKIKGHKELFKHSGNTWLLEAGKLEEFRKLLAKHNHSVRHGRALKNFWKYSEMNGGGVYIIKRVCLSKAQAEKLEKENASKGIICRISPHLNSRTKGGGR